MGLEKHIENRIEEYNFRLYLAVYNKMNKNNFMTYEEFKGKKEKLLTKEEKSDIDARVNKIRKKHNKRVKK